MGRLYGMTPQHRTEQGNGRRRRNYPPKNNIFKGTQKPSFSRSIDDQQNGGTEPVSEKAPQCNLRLLNVDVANNSKGWKLYLAFLNPNLNLNLCSREPHARGTTF